MNIYELTNDWLKFYDYADDEDMDDDSWFDMMNSIEGDIEDKAENTAKVIRMLEGRRDIKKAEAKRLSDAAKVDDNQIKRLKNGLERMMIATDKKKFNTELFKFNIQKNPPSVEIDDDVDVNKILPEYLKLPEINKSAVKDALKSGEELKWARLVQTEGLRIR